jgi:hypothetical protein
MSRGVIFQELRVTYGHHTTHPFVHAFYAFESPLFYNHYNHEGNVTIIPSTMEIRQGDPLGGALFNLAHFKASHSTTNHFSSCLFPSIVNDIHIIGFFLIISSTYEHFHIELHAIDFSIQPEKMHCMVTF